MTGDAGIGGRDISASAVSAAYRAFLPERIIGCTRGKIARVAESLKEMKRMEATKKIQSGIEETLVYACVLYELGSRYGRTTP